MSKALTDKSITLFKLLDHLKLEKKTLLLLNLYENGETSKSTIFCSIWIFGTQTLIYKIHADTRMKDICSFSVNQEKLLVFFSLFIFVLTVVKFKIII